MGSVRDKILAYGEQVIFEISTELKEKNLDSKKAFSTIRNLFGTKLIVNLLPKFDLNYANFETLELETYLFQEFWLCYESKSVELEIRQPGIIKALERTFTKCLCYVVQLVGVVMGRETHYLNIKKKHM